MPDATETPRNLLVAALFCTIIGIIAFAGFGSGLAGQKARSLLAGSKVPVLLDDARGFLP